MSGEIRGGSDEMMVATSDSVLARQLPVQKCRVCMCSPPDECTTLLALICPLTVSD